MENSDLSELHDTLFEMLCDFDDYCKKHKLDYFLTAGTLLGAVRHQDFIPWDDDVDLGMTRENYSKLLECFKENPMPGYFLQHYSTEENYLNLHIKLRKNGTRFEEHENHFQKKIHQGIFLDIFPYEKTAKQISKIKKTNIKLLGWLVSSQRWTPRKNLIKSVLSQIIRHITKPIPSNLLLKALDSYIQNKQAGEDYACPTLFGVDKYEKSIIKGREISYSKNEIIRSREFPTPAGSHEILSRAYGEYMKLPPELERIPKHKILENENERNFK